MNVLFITIYLINILNFSSSLKVTETLGRNGVKRILVVEDDTALLPMISYNLQKNGFSVKEATNGEEALLLVKEEIPSLAIIDWMIPAPSGLEVCRILRRKKEI